MTQGRVVVGVDGSPLSMAAVTRAAQVASARGFSLHVLHAFAPDLPMLGFGELSDGSAMVSNHAKRLVADGVNRAHAVDPSLEVTTGIRDGYASQALVDASRSAALVVVGAMGHGVFSRASVGAVAQVPDLQVGLREVGLGQETAAGTDGGPSEVGRLHLEDLHHQRVARARAAHPHRPRQGVAAEGPAGQHVGVGRRAGVVAIRRVARLEHHRVARVDLEAGRDGVVPLVLHLAGVEVMVHGGRSIHARARLPRAGARRPSLSSRGHRGMLRATMSSTLESPAPRVLRERRVDLPSRTLHA